MLYVECLRCTCAYVTLKSAAVLMVANCGPLSNCVWLVPLTWRPGMVVLQGQWLSGMCAGLAGIVRDGMAALHQSILQELLPQFVDVFDAACSGRMAPEVHAYAVAVSGAPWHCSFMMKSQTNDTLC